MSRIVATERSHQTRRWRIVHSEFSIGWGGQECRVMAELRGFQKRGCDVRLLAPRKAKFSSARKLKKFRRSIFKRAGCISLLKSSASPAGCEEIKFKFSTPHSSRDGWLLGIAGRLARVPLIIRTRHIDVDYPNRRLSRHAYTTLADHVLTTSEKIKKHFQEMFGLPDDRISTVPTGIDLELFSPSGAKANFPAGDQPLVGMISVLRSWKGHATFLKRGSQLKHSGARARLSSSAKARRLNRFNNSPAMRALTIA